MYKPGDKRDNYLWLLKTILCLMQVIATTLDIFNCITHLLYLFVHVVYVYSLSSLLF